MLRGLDAVRRGRLNLGPTKAPCGNMAPGAGVGGPCAAHLVDLIRFAVDFVPPLEAGGVKVGLDSLQLVATCLHHLLRAPARRERWLEGRVGQ